MQSDQRRLYSDLAWVWPIVSPKENYVEDAEEFCQAVWGYSQLEAKEILHLGCGGGHLDFTLKKYFAVTGVDVSDEMLALARQLNPEVDYQSGDMRSVRLDKTFDAVLIADSIGYMLTVDDLRATFTTAYVHLKPGGIFYTYAEEVTGRFRQNRTGYDTGSAGSVDVAFIENRYDPDPSDTTYEMVFVYLIRHGGHLTVETDRHLGGVFPLEIWLDTLKEVGFAVRLTEDGIVPVTFVCVKQI
ncbi:MAG: class I SAM-dependent methyltransferase [Anaerolineae bacterium]|nr:class I SAM-dependent methyltransferase [Anaerolineae bacterium]